MMKKWPMKVLAFYTKAALACPIYPLEILLRPLLKGPSVTLANSGPNQFAGRTTLASGSATVTVSTFQVQSDSLLSLHAQVALPAAYATQGEASIAAGAASATASTTAIYSGQYVGIAFRNETNQASGAGRGFRTSSIVGGVSFAIATDDGQNVTSGPAIVGWRIFDAIPEGLKVNTISPGNFFTLGWADGRTRPIDTAVMWEMRRTS